MSRGKKDYKVYKILPQKNMNWTLAVIYMLQSPDNIVYDCDRNPYAGSTLYRISDGIFQYRCQSWQKSRVFPADHWAQVNVSSNAGKRLTALAYHDREDCDCSLPEDLKVEAPASGCDEHSEIDDVIADRFERIESTLAQINKKLSKI